MNRKNGKVVDVWSLMGSIIALCLCFSKAGASDLSYKSDSVSGKSIEQYEPGEPFAAEGSYFLGYRFITQEDALKAAEYVYPRPSITLGIDILSAPLPYRYHLNGEYLSKYDFYADGGFAYKDIVLFRDILVGIHHNIKHYNFHLAGEPPSLLYSDKSFGDKYFVDYASNLLLMRLKAPDYPFHTFFKHRYVEREGMVQQRFLLYDNDELVLTSESRDVDWRSNAYILGANSHLGPIEIEYVYDRGEFDPQGDSALYDYYPPSSDLSRPGDIYPHHVASESQSSAHSIKIHSSYTGGLVASATVTSFNQKNNYSRVESTTWKGAVDLSWIPDPAIALFFKFRHRDVDVDTPDFFTLEGLVHTLNYPVRNGVSYVKDIFSLSARYRPLNTLSLVSLYEFEHIEKENIDDWYLIRTRSLVHTINLTAHVKPWNKLKLKGVYEYKYYDEPAYNTDPDNSNLFRLTATYYPVHGINLYLDYYLKISDRSGLKYLNSDPSVVLEKGNRDGRRDQLLAGLSWMFTPNAMLTVGWAYNRWNIDQDLAYGKISTPEEAGLPFFDVGVPYTDEANSFSLGLHVIPRDDISITADVTYTLSEGEFVPGDVLTGNSSSFISQTDIDVAETVFSLGINKKLPQDWELGFKFHTDVYDDRTDGLQDGELFITTFSVKRYF